MPTEDLLPPTEDDRFSNPLEARKKAMDYLARREYGKEELRAKLRDFGFDAETAHAAVERLTDDGLQSDRRFVESFVQSRISQGKGPVRIRLDLNGRGIDAELVTDFLRGADCDWITLAREVRQRKFGSARPRDFREKARQMRFLQYRGFEPDQVQAAVAADSE